MSNDYTDSGNNTRDQIITFSVFFLCVIAAFVAAMYFSAGWFFYVLIGLFSVILIFVVFDQKRLTGDWSIHLTPSDGGQIQTPMGSLRFSESDLLGIYVIVASKKHDDTGVPVRFLVLRQGLINLSNAALDNRKLKRYLKKTRPHIPIDKHVKPGDPLIEGVYEVEAWDESS